MDRYIFSLIHDLSGRNFFLDILAIFFANYLAYILAVAALFLVFGENGYKHKLIFFSEAALAIILSRGIITEVIRFFYYNPRPFELLKFTPLIPESGGSFPSGHAAFFFALSLIIFYWRKNWGVICLSLSFLMGLARIFAGVHWPSDILSGAVIGLLSAMFIHYSLRNYRLTAIDN